MFKGLLAKRALRKLEEAIVQEDLKFLNELSPETRTNLPGLQLSNGQPPLVFALLSGRAKALSALVIKDSDLAESTDPTGTPLPHLALISSPAPLSTLSALLEAGASPNLDFDGMTLLERAFSHEDQQALPLASRLLQYGAEIKASQSLLIEALRKDLRQRIKFLIESGIEWQDSMSQHCINQETAQFAKRIWDDKNLRDLWF